MNPRQRMEATVAILVYTFPEKGNEKDAFGFFSNAAPVNQIVAGRHAKWGF